MTLSITCYVTLMFVQPIQERLILEGEVGNEVFAAAS